MLTIVRQKNTGAKGKVLQKRPHLHNQCGKVHEMLFPREK